MRFNFINLVILKLGEPILCKFFKSTTKRKCKALEIFLVQSSDQLEISPGPCKEVNCRFIVTLLHKQHLRFPTRSRTKDLTLLHLTCPTQYFIMKNNLETQQKYSLLRNGNLMKKYSVLLDFFTQLWWYTHALGVGKYIHVCNILMVWKVSQHDL